MSRPLPLLALALLTATAPAAARPQPEQGKPQRLAAVPLTIATANRTLRFRTEVARTEAQQARGMMFRTRMGPGEAMLFPMRPPRFASFWMKNTLIPLDIIFIRPNGTIHRIVTARPRDLTPVQSHEPVAAVLEIPGGAAARLGIAEGDRVASSALPK